MSRTKEGSGIRTLKPINPPTVDIKPAAAGKEQTFKAHDPRGMPGVSISLRCKPAMLVAALEFYGLELR